MAHDNPHEPFRRLGRESLTRRSLLGQAAGVAIGAVSATRPNSLLVARQHEVARSSRPPGSPEKTVYISFLLHGNMCYDRYTKQEIRAKFPRIYAAGVRAMRAFPGVTAHIDFPGLTLLSLKHYAPWFLNELKPLVDRKQVTMVGCQYAASHALCSDEESDLVASWLTMEMLRDTFQTDISTFFPQEIVFHPQMPYIMRQIGAKRLIVMPDGWNRPKRVRGMDGSSVVVYPLDLRAVRCDRLEEFYDTHPDGSFVMGGGDFERLDNIEAYVREIDRLAKKGKHIKWTTVESYEEEVGIHDECDAPHPFGQAREDREPSPSFSRWVGRPDDMIWHRHAVRATDAVRMAGFAKLTSTLHAFGVIDPPLAQQQATLPDNPWDTRFEEANEYPETEPGYLAADGAPTVLSRAWHHLLIGLNSDASGWCPWSPRTRHRITVLDSSHALSSEVIARFAQQLASRIGKPKHSATGYVLAINTMPSRIADLSLKVEGPRTFVNAEGTRIPTVASLHDGQWVATARVPLPDYGYKLLGLEPSDDVLTQSWTSAHKAAFAGRQVSLVHGSLTIREGSKRIEVKASPFRLTDPSGTAPEEQVAPTWNTATTRVRSMPNGCDFEVFTELAWAVWLKLVIGLRHDRVEVLASVYVDLPRRIGNFGYDPNGLRLEFHGQPGRASYDVPYATIEHGNGDPSFVAVQRFAALDSGKTSFAVVALGGNQSFQIAAKAGILAPNLGVSLQGRADTRPQCIIRPDGYGEHKITSGGDPMLGTYEHRFAIVFDRPAGAAVSAHALRTPVPLVHIEPGNGDWPAERSLLDVKAPAAHVTAFRSDHNGCYIVVNDLSGKASHIECGGRKTALPAFGISLLEL